MHFISAVLFFIALADTAAVSQRKFWIDYTKKCFSAEDTCVQLMSGSLHYTRVPYQYWEDRIVKYKAAGLNTIQTYVPWSKHEPYEGVFDFSENGDIALFLDIAHKNGMYVILRPGPYICAEMDYGGFPWWLLRYERMQIRSSDPLYLSKVDEYMTHLFQIVRPYLYENGGPIISVQVENEYGYYYTCDENYMHHLVKLFRSNLGENVILFTTDPPYNQQLKCGTTNVTYTTVDFGTFNIDGVKYAFKQQDMKTGGGPRMNSEFYPGWYDSWGGDHANVSIDKVLLTMEAMWSMNASFNFYMFHGGTNFGFNTAGLVSTGPSSYISVTTSYDYNGPLSEWGDITPKYLAIRQAIENHTGQANPLPLPKPGSKLNLGNLTTVSYIPGDQLATKIGLSLQPTRFPQTFESMGVGYGFVLYETNLDSKDEKLMFPQTSKSQNGNTTLTIEGALDRGYVSIDTEYLGVVERGVKRDFEVQDFEGTKNLRIIVENRGRIGFGKDTGGRRGLTQNVTVNGQIVENWQPYALEPQNAFGQKIFENFFHSKKIYQPEDHQNFFHSKKIDQPTQPGPGVYGVKFYLTADQVADTFFDPGQFTKGQVYINGINLGRYWPSKGPQVRLYLPAPYLKQGANELVLFELENPGDMTVQLVDKPMLSKK